MRNESQCTQVRENITQILAKTKTMQPAEAQLARAISQQAFLPSILSTCVRIPRYIYTPIHTYYIENCYYDSVRLPLLLKPPL